jgi:hypothetical protein
MSERRDRWLRKNDDVRWQYGVPPRGNANLLSSELRTENVPNSKHSELSQRY